MRKGYGPTGASFHYTFKKFVDNAKNGEINVSIGSSISSFDLSEQTEEALREFFELCDCAVYEGGKFIHVIV